MSVQPLRGGRTLALALALAAVVASAGAAPRQPSSDEQVVETLPGGPGATEARRRLRAGRGANAADPKVAVEAASAYLGLARTQGDARYAGQALAALRHWANLPPDQTPPEVLVMRATVQQFIHDFDGAEASLKAALARQPGNAQAWLTLATIRRVRGRLAESDAACQATGRTGPAVYGIACLAENAALRGRHDEARASLRTLLQEPALRGAAQAGLRQWLWTTLAEVEELAGRPADADAAYREALPLGEDGYLRLAYADFLLQQGRAAEVALLLAAEPRSDAVLLRLAIAETRSAPRNGSSREELTRRFDAAAQRPEGAVGHAREQAMFALDVQGDARQAVALARQNVALQREPIDLLLLARAAMAAKDDIALAELRRLRDETGMKDARIDALR
ncbi:hypothetical protein [Pseudacidovorax sp. RU35E]|uniref:hypothetical protein n=1 Tax=Pseudacidovorax sp. RU35E TaxID=1907403 RepID=UPI0009553350|nr:hypothetical protein [Pseudacidovorax sp. RU35E]SIR47283.1 hypothetical protein SAMN05880557_111181 [Pseudacidovorax sp. RU35E]